MINAELAAAIEDIQNRAIVRGEQLMHARASDLLEICKIAVQAAPMALNAAVVTYDIADESHKEKELKAAQSLANAAPTAEALTEPLNAKIAELDQKLAEASAAYDESQATVDQIAIANQELEKELAELKAKPAPAPVDLDAVVAPLRKTIASHEAAILKLEEEKAKEASTAAAQIKELQAVIVSKDKKIAKLTAD